MQERSRVCHYSTFRLDAPSNEEKEDGQGPGGRVSGHGGLGARGAQGVDVRTMRPIAVCGHRLATSRPRGVASRVFRVATRDALLSPSPVASPPTA